MNDLREKLRKVLSEANEIIDMLAEMDECPKADRAAIWEIGCIFSGCLGMVPIPATDETIGANLKLIDIIKTTLDSNPSEAESGKDINIGNYLGVEEKTDGWGLDEIDRWNEEKDGEY